MTDVRKLGLEMMPSGVAGLDTILGGGFLKGGLYIPRLFGNPKKAPCESVLCRL